MAQSHKIQIVASGFRSDILLKILEWRVGEVSFNFRVAASLDPPLSYVDSACKVNSRQYIVERVHQAAMRMIIDSA